MLRHLTLPLALGTVIVCGMERVDLGDGFQLELRHVGVDHDEFLLVEQDAIGKTQLGDLAFWPACPWTEVADRHGQGLEGLRPLRAEDMEAGVLAGSPRLVTHTNSDLDCG